MKTNLEEVLPEEIEARSFAIITEELGTRTFPPDEAPVVKRVIHATADFDYADNLVFTNGAVAAAKDAIRRGASIVTDTQMARAGINKKALAQFGGEVLCFMSDEDVAEAAKRNQTTRAAASMEKAAAVRTPMIFAVGNAPTALAALCEMVQEGRIRPAAVIGVPVGFVNVEAAKEMLLQTDVPSIVARGRKGGSGVAAAVCNAILYEMTPGRP